MNFLASPVNRAIVLGAVAVIIALFSYFTVVQPALTQYAQANARLQDDINSYNSLKAVADQKPQYIALTKQIQSQLASVSLTADPRVYIPSYLKQIENLAKQDGLQVTSVTPQATPSPSASASPAATSGVSTVPGSIANTGPTQSATRALQGQNAQNAVTQGVAQTTGGVATPIPGNLAPAGAAGSGPPAPGAPTRGGQSSARANAIAYLNQSFSQVPINMELSGTYTQLETFLKDLNKFPKLIGVGNVTMTPGAHQDVGATPMLNIILPIVAYRLSPSSGGPGLPVAPGTTNSTGVGGNGG